MTHLAGLLAGHDVEANTTRKIACQTHNKKSTRTAYARMEEGVTIRWRQRGEIVEMDLDCKQTSVRMSPSISPPVSNKGYALFLRGPGSQAST